MYSAHQQFPCKYAQASTSEACCNLHAHVPPTTFLPLFKTMILQNKVSKLSRGKQNFMQVYSLEKHSGRMVRWAWLSQSQHWKSAVFVFECVVPPSTVICILIEWELCCLSCIILNIVCRMDLIDSAMAPHIKRAQHRHIRIIHSGNRGPQDHQMNIKPLIKARLWHDTLPRSWAASDNESMPGYDEKCGRG